MDRSFFIVVGGSRPEPPAVGITVMDNVLVVVSVRTEPLRITGIYRHDLSSADMSAESHDKRLRRALRRCRRRLCLPRGIAATVALQPQERDITLRLDHRVGETVRVRCRPSLPRLLEEAGFESDSFDVLPVALARVALCGSHDRVSLRHRSGWTVRVAAASLEANWSCGPRTDTTAGRNALTEIAETMVVQGVHVPAKLQPILDIGLDAGALGAALCACGLAPRIGREPNPDVIDLGAAEGQNAGYRLTASVSTR